MKKVVYILLSLFCLANILLLFSCKTRQIVQPAKTVVSTVEKVIKQTTRDTTFIVAADSSFYNAWIECRDGKPVLKKDTTTKQFSLSPLRLKKPFVTLSEDGQLNIECFTENLELKARINDLTTEINNTTSTVEQIPIEVVKDFTSTQKLFIILGKIFGCILLLLIGYGVFKLVSKFYVKR